MFRADPSQSAFSKAWRSGLTALAAAGCVASSDGTAIADAPQMIATPTGKMITPTAARGAIFQDLNPRHADAPDIRAGQAAAVSVSPDGRLLAILTSGYNLHYGQDGKLAPALSTEYVFLFDISGGKPTQMQVLRIPNTFQGLGWSPSSDRLFISGGKDDNVVEYVRDGSSFAPARTFRLGHSAGVGSRATPMSGALAISPDGTRLLVANVQHESVSLIDLKSGQVVAEQDLRPGIIDPKRHGEPGGSFPRCVAWTSDSHAYVGSERDREILSLEISRAKIDVVRRLPVRGQPVALLAKRNGNRLYAALDNTDQVAVFETGGGRDALVEELNAVAPEAVYPNAKKLGGANSNALALTPDERTLLVSNGGENAIAVVRLGERAIGADPENPKTRNDDDRDKANTSGASEVIGLVPTGWYPTGVATSKDGSTWYVVNGKSPAGPNVRWCKEVDPARNMCVARRSNGKPGSENGMRMLVVEDQYTHQLEKAGFLSVPAPPSLELARLTKQVARNNRFDSPEIAAKDEQLFAFLRKHIKHVIYIVKENRTYDQVLGDLAIGNGDPRLTLFPEAISPNHHAIARTFTTLDNFLISGEVSWTGWDWSTAARTNDFRERQEPISMANRGLTGETALNRNVNVGFATNAERRAHDPLSPDDPDVLPGTRDIYELDGPGGEPGKGYLWDAALRRGLTIRNWGFFGDPGRMQAAPLVHDPYSAKLRVYFPTKSSLMPYSDPYYRDFDPALPDFWRVQEWRREFAAFSNAGSAPNLMLVRLGNDHFGMFDRAIDGVNTPDTQMADNDYALGLMIETVANSPFAKNTLIISIEDDALDGPDHVDAFRSIALLAGPYVRQHALVSTRYTTVSVVKTIEEILGIEPVGLNDALASPMSDLFDPAVTTWTYRAIAPQVLRTTTLPLPHATHACITSPRGSSTYWANAMAGQNFSAEDRVDPVAFNRALWRGLRRGEAYPVTRTGSDMRTGRALLVARANTFDGGCAAPASH